MVCTEKDFTKIISILNKKNFCVDESTCSVFDQKIIESKFSIVLKKDPIYELKSIKNKIEIKNTLKAHKEDGVALTKFLYWFKNNKKRITEERIEKKLQKFRQKSKKNIFKII